MILPLGAMSLVRDVILTADDELRYPTSGELVSIVAYLNQGADRARVADLLTGNERKIIEKASRQLFKQRPEYVQPGGNAFGQKQRAQCLRDYSWYLRLVTYGILAASTDYIEQVGLVGAREMYNALQVPMAGMVDAMVTLKEASLSLLSTQDANLAAPYFDFMVQGMETLA